jgi:hypothetical protein
VEDKRFEKWKILILIDEQGGEKQWKVNEKGERKRDEKWMKMLKGRNGKWMKTVEEKKMFDAD